MAALETPVCNFGWVAPDFELMNVDGQRYSLQQLRGEHGTLVMFLSVHCPFVRACIDRIIRDVREMQGHGIASIAVMSNDTKAYPADSLENMRAWSDEKDFPFPFLYDETQAVARQYEAVCTPDFFGFNADLELQYRGRLDAGRTEPPPPGAARELCEAMVQIAAVGRGPRKQIASIGCSIKWI